MFQINDLIPKKEPNFERNENDGVLLLFSTKADSKLLNRTATIIYNLIDGKLTAKAILDKMSDYYPDVDKSILEKDLINILFTLYNQNYISLEGIMQYIDGNYFVDELLYKPTSEYYRGVIKRINSFDHKHNLITSREMAYYSIHSLRTRSFYLNECYFVCIKNNKIVAALSYYDLKESQATILSSFICAKKEYQALCDLYSFSKKYLYEKGFRKIKVVHLGEFNPQMICELYKLGFHHEATLKKEKDNKNMYFFSDFLDETTEDNYDGTPAK